MISINRTHVDALSKQLNSKQTYGKNDAILYPIFAHTQVNTNDALRDFSTYEMAHWTNYVDRWLSSRSSRPNTIGYKRGTILFVDLGAGNFGHEPSFTHPCIVLDQNKDSILIVPCSSKKYGKGFPEIIDATADDGFSTNTGIQTNSIRWISKNRVISVIGNTNSEVLDKIDALMLESIPLHTKKLLDKDKKISSLEKDKANLETEIRTLKSLLTQQNSPANNEAIADTENNKNS